MLPLSHLEGTNMTKGKRVAIYLRVSTDGQTVENQRRELRAAAKRHGWRVVETFADEGISGAKSRDKRPGLDKLLMGVARQTFHLIPARPLHTPGPSLQHPLPLL